MLIIDLDGKIWGRVGDIYIYKRDWFFIYLFLKWIEFEFLYFFDCFVQQKVWFSYVFLKIQMCVSLFVGMLGWGYKNKSGGSKELVGRIVF